MKSALKMVRAVSVTWMVAISSSAVSQDGGFCYGEGTEACPPPERWPQECTVGLEQSPIDAFAGQRGRFRPLMFRYHPTPLRVISNGHTLEVEYQEDQGSLRVGRKQCRLLQFHFHTSSEHRLGGISYPMEAHLVHQCGPDDLVVVGVMMDYIDDVPNPALQDALDNAAVDPSSGVYVVDTVEVPEISVSARDLLPRHRRFYSRDHYAYSGSLTTPPCSEVVQWFLLKRPVGISRAQVEAFQQLLADTSGDGHPFNNRPVQDLNDRWIDESGQRFH